MSKRSRKQRQASAGKATAAVVKMAGGYGGPGEAMPPSKGAPPAVFPIAVNPAPNAFAPAPINDRFPLVIGQQLTLSYIASVFRLATTGYRQQLVDLLNELLEQDAHLFSVVSKRITSSAVGRVAITPCKLPDDHPDRQDAEDLANFVENELDRIPDLTRSLAELLWAVYYGLSAQEIYWTRDSDGWHIERLSFIHSRRLSYPDYQSWSVHIWDQGQVYGWSAPWGSSPTNSNMFGLRIEDYPGKFVVHTPQLRGDYPTRDGIGRQTATWAAFKRIGGRGASEYLERFAKPLMDVTFTRGADEHGHAVPASEEDIALAATIAASIGPGSGSFASHADTIKINTISHGEGTSGKLTWEAWMGLCNAEMSKASLGGTLGTEVGKGGGNRSLGEVQERAETDLEKYDCNALAETIRRDIVAWIVRLNRPNMMHLLPQVKVHVDSDPNPKAILDLAKQLTDMGAPVDLDATANQVGISLVNNDDEDEAKPRQSYRTDLAATVLALTKVDYPVDLDALAKLTGIPIVALEDLDKARRSRIVTGGPMSPVEPDGSSDPNDPNYKPLPAATPGAPVAPGENADAAPVAPGVKAPPVGKPKAPPPDVDKAADAAPDKVAATDAEQVNAAMRGMLLLSDRKDKQEAQAVFDLLSEDYPKNRLDWILSGHWEGPLEVPLEDIDFANADSWRASHEDVTPYCKRIQKAIDTNGKEGNRKPAVLVKTPGNPKYIIVDGHHRTLASKQLGIPLLAFVSHVHVEDGPWMSLHSAQKSGSSKGSASYASYRTASYQSTSYKLKGEAAAPADTFRGGYWNRR